MVNHGQKVWEQSMEIARLNKRIEKLEEEDAKGHKLFAKVSKEKAQLIDKLIKIKGCVEYCKGESLRQNILNILAGNENA